MTKPLPTTWNQKENTNLTGEKKNIKNVQTIWTEVLKDEQELSGRQVRREF